MLEDSDMAKVKGKNARHEINLSNSREEAL